MSVLNRNHLDSPDVVTGTSNRMVQTYKIAVLGDGGVGKSGEKNSSSLYIYSLINLGMMLSTLVTVSLCLLC